MNIKCLLFGHIERKVTWYNENRMCFNHKGGKKRGAGVIKKKTKHYRIYCDRCGKLLKKG